MVDFSKIAVNIKTFLRDEHMYAAVKGILHNMPGAQIIIADDGRMTPEKSAFYENLRNWGHIAGYFPFDSGFGFKNNWIAQSNKRPYLLIGCDDFDFTASAAEGVLKLQEVLENSDVDIAAGRLGDLHYEFLLDTSEWMDKGIVREIPLDADINGRGEWFIECDLTVNYHLIKRRVLERVQWDEDVKIGGGDHGAFFLDVKYAGFKVAYVPGVRIDLQKRSIPAEYKPYRRRAYGPERPCFDRRGIKKYILGNGQVDYAVS
jgi:hypothetical protein